MAVIDADAHVVEWERTWEYMDESEMAFRPRVMVFKDAAQKPSGQRAGEYWMIGGRVFAKDGNIGFDIPKEKREAADIEARLAHMDDLGVDVQVLYPSLFLRMMTALPHVDAALCKSYNRWLADIWQAGKGRLRWVVIPPLHYMDKAIEELNLANRTAPLPGIRQPINERMRASPFMTCGRSMLPDVSIGKRLKIARP